MSKNTRDVFFDEIYEKIRFGEDIVVVSADLAAPSLDRFRVDFPNRYISVGIAEQNLLAVSVGLAQNGKKVIAYGCSPFVWARGYEFIRVLLGCMNVPVTVLSLCVGFNFSTLGPTHFSTEDISVLRSIPYLKINTAYNATMAKELLTYSLDCKHPNFIRMEHTLTDNLFEKREIDYEKGFITHSVGKDLTIVTINSTTAEAIAAAQSLGKKGLAVGVTEVISIPLDEKALIESLDASSSLMVVEEHSLQGGLSSYICEMMCDRGIHKSIKRIGLDFKDGFYYSYGKTSEVQHLFGLDKQGIEQSAIQFIGK